MKFRSRLWLLLEFLALYAGMRLFTDQGEWICVIAASGAASIYDLQRKLTEGRLLFDITDRQLVSASAQVTAMQEEIDALYTRLEEVEFASASHRSS
ncbi:hypothetical protein [Duganella sp. S19_KUP01_CR8]|uniref:hypothetical protein n=1 Tax=Duganella sp. S19_KUP01_CR8 TaxID=3025502 RepID=UPI002FCDA0AE